MSIAPDLPALIAAASEGSTRAFEELYRALSPGVLRYLRAKNYEEAEDLAAEVWAEVARRMSSFVGGEGDFRAVLFTIARRRVHDHWRWRQRRPSDPVEPDELGDHPALDQPDGVVIEAMDAQRAVDRLVRHLSEPQAEVVLLRVLGGLSVDEVAHLLGRSPGAVRALQHRALKRLARDNTVQAVPE